jgi:cytochrome c-type biogenesis protein CcmH/NrfG
VTKADPWNSTARYYLALACEKVGRLREAVEAYKGYIHCAVPRDDETIRHARERIRELEGSPHR